MRPTDTTVWPSRILIADDEAHVLAMYRRLLSSLEESAQEREWREMERSLFGGDSEPMPFEGPYRVTCCLQGDEAVEAVNLSLSEGQPYAVAFMDMRMPPGPNGLETGKRIRALDPDVQIVFCTAYSDVDPRRIAREIPPPDRLFYAQKPLHPHELRQFASALSARWRAEHEARVARAELQDRREQLREQARLESLGRLAGGVAHGFNNILAMAMGFIELAQRDLDPQSRAAKHLARALRATDDGARLTNRLLSAGRRQQLRLEEVDINALIQGMSETIRCVVGSAVRVEMNLDPRRPLVAADPSQLREVLLNLTTNARDAMPEGGEMTISTSVLEVQPGGEDDHPRPCMALEVADTGCGMDEETARRAFDPFFTTKPARGSAGLGLAACHGIIQQHGGEMTLATTLDRGTRVRILLHRTEPGADLRPARQRAGELPRGKERILLVEDMPELRMIVREMLTQLGYQVSVAGGTAEALALVAETDLSCDLLLTDVVMPDADGSELLRRIQEVRPKVRVLFMSGLADLAQQEAWPLLNMGNFLPKPFTVAQLAHKIREVLD